jgi:hypothetical protein
MNRFPHFLGAFASAAISLAPVSHAAEDNPPTPPFLAKVESPLTVIRNFQRDGESAKSPPPENALPRIIRTITEIHEPIRRVRHFIAGQSEPSDFWIAEGMMLGDHPTVSGSLFIDEGTKGGTGSDLVSVFPEANWVNLGNFVQWEKLDGIPCRVHKANIPPTKSALGGENPNILSGDATAWIDDITRRPVKVKTAAETILFSYEPGPAKPLALPSKFAQVFQSLRYGPSGQMR